MSYIRSEDVSVRKSPSVSAKVYQPGTKKVGNDGNLWIIVRDNRGVQRWQKYRGAIDEPQQPVEKVEPKVEEKPKMDSVWESVKNKFSEVYFEEEDFNNPNEIYSNQVKAEEYQWMFDRYSPYKSSLSWSDAENKFLKMLTSEEKSIIKIEKNIKNVHELFGVMSEKKILVKRINAEEEKEKEKFLKGIRASIEGLKMLIEDEPELKPTIEEKVKKRITGLDVLAEDGDEGAAEASKMMRAYLKESFKFGGKVKKMQEDEEFYEKALRNAKRKSDRDYFLKKLNELDNQKARF
jgi:hypothetical protein